MGRGRVFFISILVAMVILCSSLVFAVAPNDTHGWIYYAWKALSPLFTLIIVVLVVGIIAKYSGAGEILINIQHFFSNFFNGVRSIFSTMVSSAPRFIQILFFIILFWGFGALIYNWTIGLPAICSSNGTVMVGDISSGIIYNFLPQSQLAYKDNKLLSGALNHTYIYTNVFSNRQNVTSSGFTYKYGDKYLLLVPESFAGVWVDDQSNEPSNNPLNWFRSIVPGKKFCLLYDYATNSNVLDICGAGRSGDIFNFYYIASSPALGDYSLDLYVDYMVARTSLSSVWNKAKAVTNGDIQLKIGDDVFNVNSTNYVPVMFTRTDDTGISNGRTRIMRIDGVGALCSANSPEGCVPTENEVDVSNDKESFLRDSGAFTAVKTRNNDVFSYKCNCVKFDSSGRKCISYDGTEKLLVAGLPIFDTTFMFMLVGIFALVYIIGIIRRH